MRESLKKMIEKLAIKVVKKDTQSACTFGLYQPVRPKKLKKVEK